MGWFKNVRDAQDKVREVDDQMDKVQANVRRGGPRVSAKEHERLQKASEDAAAARRSAFWGGR
jgi:hypothetical protein